VYIFLVFYYRGQFNRFYRVVHKLNVALYEQDLNSVQHTHYNHVKVGKNGGKKKDNGVDLPSHQKQSGSRPQMKIYMMNLLKQ
jgi:hypothetical protein